MRLLILYEVTNYDRITYVLFTVYVICLQRNREPIVRTRRRRTGCRVLPGVHQNITFTIILNINTLNQSITEQTFATIMQT